MSSQLSGRTVLVTGGAVRVGAAISRTVALAGARVAIHCHHHLQPAQQMAEELSACGATAAVFQADLLAASSVGALFDRIEEELGPLDGLVNNAGLISETPLVSYDPEEARRLFALNVQVPLLTMAELARRKPAMAAIVNVVDSSAERAWLGHAAYCASKSALLAATRVAARELAPAIRVNAVNPGTVMLREEELPRVAALLNTIPLQRFGDPKDVAEAVLFLLAASYVTGAVLAVDGGRNLQM
ncbi:MAG: SDR family oxidoreductase [Bradymonadales bacterium]|nr:SDR family oxidoreductase [Bradymonadales bacterium]